MRARSYLLKFKKSNELVTFMQHKNPAGAGFALKGGTNDGRASMVLIIHDIQQMPIGLLLTHARLARISHFVEDGFQ